MNPWSSKIIYDHHYSFADMYFSSAIQQNVLFGGIKSPLISQSHFIFSYTNESL